MDNLFKNFVNKGSRYYYFNFDRDIEGIILPTLRNNKIVDDLYQEHKSVEKLQEILGEDYTKIAMSSLFDPRKENVFFKTPELARKAKERADLINRLNQEWLSTEF